MTQGQPDSVVYRRRLRTALRNTRERKGLTQRDVAKAMDWSLSKLIRIETGQVGISTNDLRALLAHYDVSEQAEVARFVDFSRASRERSTWSSYADVASPEYQAFLSYESAAKIIRSYEPFFCPGLLQHPDYSRAIISSSTTDIDPQKVDRIIELRLERQRIIDRADPPELYVILDEAVLHRSVGGSAVMRRQLIHLRDLAERPRIDVLVVPFSVGAYPLLRVSGVLIELAEPEDPNVLFVERPSGEIIVREDESAESVIETPGQFLEAFYALEDEARAANATTNLIEAALKDL